MGQEDWWDGERKIRTAEDDPAIRVREADEGFVKPAPVERTADRHVEFPSVQELDQALEIREVAAPRFSHVESRNKELNAVPWQIQELKGDWGRGTADPDETMTGRDDAADEIQSQHGIPKTINFGEEDGLHRREDGVQSIGFVALTTRYWSNSSGNSYEIAKIESSLAESAARAGHP